MAAASPRRPGYTLLELLLVMAVIVMISAAVYPSLDNSYGYFKVNGAADAVKGAWVQARARAIEDATPYRFAVVPGTTHYRVAPDKPEYWSGNPPDNTNSTDNPPLVLAESLPKGILFQFGNEGATSEEKDDNSSDDKATIEPASYKTAAVFLPDGTARDDVEVVLQGKGTNPLTLRLRALTGTVKTLTAKESR